MYIEIGQVMKMTESKKDRVFPFKQATACLVPRLQLKLKTLSIEEMENCEEIRLRCGRPMQVNLGEGEKAVGSTPVAPQELAETLNRATQYSVHSFSESLKNGFVTIEGGHRVGVCGTAVVQNGLTSTFKNISSLNIRIAREVIGAAGEEAVSHVMQDGFPVSTLVLSPPGRGKTTFLRDLMRRISDSGVRVGAADERCELCGVFRGVPQFDIGAHTDVVDCCPKAQALMMLVKTMSPQVLILDEITSENDAEAVLYASHCGVSVLASAHAADFADFERRSLYRKVLSMGVFQQIVEIGEGRCLSWRRIEEGYSC